MFFVSTGFGFEPARVMPAAETFDRGVDVRRLLELLEPFVEPLSEERELPARRRASEPSPLNTPPFGFYEPEPSA